MTENAANVEARGGGGGHLHIDGDGDVPLGGGENLTLSQTARRTKNTPCDNIPY